MTDTRARVAILLSGGMDSTAALALAAATEEPILAISADYRQRHVRELQSAREIAEHYEIEHVVLDLSGWGALLTGSALTDPDVAVPDGRYEEGSMRSTVVPNRNATLLMAAASVAIARGAEQLWTAIHAGDHALYPDCRPEFLEAINAALRAGSGSELEIVAPFIDVDKSTIAQIGADLSAPLEISWSCYRGGELHCGSCGTCTERSEAFMRAGLLDLTEYA